MYLGREEKENNCSLGGGGREKENSYEWGEEQKERWRTTVVI